MPTDEQTDHDLFQDLFLATITFRTCVTISL